jgi:hypothetical protein
LFVFASFAQWSPFLIFVGATAVLLIIVCVWRMATKAVNTTDDVATLASKSGYQLRVRTVPKRRLSGKDEEYNEDYNEIDSRRGRRPVAKRRTAAVQTAQPLFKHNSTDFLASSHDLLPSPSMTASTSHTLRASRFLPNHTMGAALDAATIEAQRFMPLITGRDHITTIWPLDSRRMLSSAEGALAFFNLDAEARERELMRLRDTQKMTACLPYLTDSSESLSAMLVIGGVFNLLRVIENMTTCKATRMLIDRFCQLAWTRNTSGGDVGNMLDDIKRMLAEEMHRRDEERQNRKQKLQSQKAAQARQQEQVQQRQHRHHQLQNDLQHLQALQAQELPLPPLQMPNSRGYQVDFAAHTKCDKCHDCKTCMGYIMNNNSDFTCVPCLCF